MGDNNDFSKRIKCDGCQKNLLELRFSESSKKKYRESLAKNRRDAKTPVKVLRCLDCNAGNRQEMKCVMCDQTLDLDQFSKAQRKRTDDAHCKNCQQDKDDLVAHFDKAVNEEEILAEATNSINLGLASSRYSSTVSAVRRSRLGNAVGDQLETDTNPGSDSWVYGNDAISLDGSDLSRTSSAHDQTKTGSGWEAFGQTRRPMHPHPASSRTSNNLGFAKQGAVGRTAEEKAADTMQREHARNQQRQEQILRDDSDEGSEVGSDFAF